jgi:DNA-binding beta-propeller fold protein YncE
MSAPAVPAFEVVEGWGRDGQPWNFAEVADVAVHSDDTVFAYGRKESAVLRFDPDGRQVARWGAGDTVRAHGISISPIEPAVFCVDCDGHAVHKYTMDGERLSTIDSRIDVDYTGYTRFDSYSVQRGGPPFCYPTAVTFGPTGDLYVSDGYGNARVHRFSPDGELLSSWGEPGEAPGQFVLPHAILVDGDRLYVADRENDRVQIFDLDGNYLDEWGECYRPAGMVKDATGLIVLAELGRVNVAKGAERYFDFDAPHGRITLREPSGRVVTTLSSDGGAGPDEYFSPHGVAVDSRGDIYVAETYVTYFRGTAPPRTALRKFRRTH